MKSERFYPADCAVFPAGKGKILIRNRNTGENRFLPAAQYELYRFLSGCSSFEEHLSTLVQANRYGIPANYLREFVSEWVKSGLLRPESLLHHQRPEGQNHEHAALSAAVISSDRPASLVKWLESRIEHPDFCDARIPICIFDDSRNPANAKRNRKTAAACKKVYPGSLVYFGQEEKSIFRESLIAACRREAISPRLVDFALYGPEDGTGYIRTGANRNTALLISGRGKTWFSDDDLYYQLYSHPLAVQTGRHFAEGGYSHIKFFASHEEMQNYVLSVDNYNLPREISAHLGSPVSITDGGDSDLSALSPETARVIEEKRALLGAVSTGYCGARWFTDRFFIDSQRFFTDDEIYLDKYRYSAAVESGLNIHAPEVPTVRDGFTLQGGGLALDGALELPACFPVDRQEDSSFGVLFLAVNQSARTLHLPVALYHDPKVKKTGLSGINRDLLPGPGRMHHLLLGEMVRQFVAGSAEARLKEAAQKFIWVSSLSPASFRELLQSRYSNFVKNRIELSTRLLDLYNAEPSWWAESVTAYLDALHASIQGDPLAKLPGGFQEWLRLYGELLEVWPLIRDKAAIFVSESQLC